MEIINGKYDDNYFTIKTFGKLVIYLQDHVRIRIKGKVIYEQTKKFWQTMMMGIIATPDINK